MKVRAVIQARMMSRRLRGKSLLAVAGKPLLSRVLERVQAMPFIDEVMVATTPDAADDPIVALAEKQGARVYRGDPYDLLGRFVEATQDLHDDDVVVRFTADNPLYDPIHSEAAWMQHAAEKWDYTHIDGLSHIVPEFVRVGTLRRCAQSATDPFEREHVTPFLRKHKSRFRVQMLPADFAGLRPDLDKFLTLDSLEDLRRFDQMLKAVEKPDQGLSIEACYAWLDEQEARLRIPDIQPGQWRASLGGREVGDGCPTFMVAEIGQNHNGRMDLAKKLIELAARCGANAVKFQKRDIHWDLTEEAYNRPYNSPNSFGRIYGEHREFLELSEEQHWELREYAQSYDLLYFCTACDHPSVEAMERIGNPVYKIASRDITNIPLLRRIAQTGKPVIISTGMAGMQEIREALAAVGDGPSAIILMQCISQYPAELERINLRAMEALRREFGCLVGLSDHTPGIITSVAASVLGACVIEKHISLSRAMKGTDQAASLEEEELWRMVKYIRDTELAMGDGKKEFDPAAEPARQKLARSLTSRVFIAKGTTLTEEMLVLKSPGTGLPWRERAKIVGKKAARDIPANYTLCEEDFAPLKDEK